MYGDAGALQLGQEALDTLRKVVLTEFSEIGNSVQVEPHEIPRGLVLEFNKWTEEGGLLAGLGKPHRAKLLAHYRHSIEMEYNRISVLV